MNQLKEARTFNDNYYPQGFSKVDVPAGKRGIFEVKKFTLKDEIGLSLANLRNIRDGRSYAVCPPGSYTKLVTPNRLLMSDTPYEAHTNLAAYEHAKGHVLLNGLGLGFLLKAILAKAEVSKVTVVERESDVIKLVGKHYFFNLRKNVEFSIIHADALEHKPRRGEYFQCVWHDIWDEACADNLEQMKMLTRRYGRLCDWQGCWSRAEIMRLG